METTMNELQILMNGAMVRSVLNCTKSQTRRIVKPQPADDIAPATFPNRDSQGWRSSLRHAHGNSTAHFCPFGQPGDRLWVRETFYAYGRWETRYSAKKKRDEWHFVDMTIECDRRYQYAADNPDMPLATGRGGAVPRWYTRPAIFMPRAACRILLEITAVRVERLQDISEADAAAEGIEPLFSASEIALRPELASPLPSYKNYLWHGMHGAWGTGNAKSDAWPYQFSAYKEAILSFSSLWESINGAGSWALNPWVWAVEFRRIES
jgi:hypothetical protein